MKLCATVSVRKLRCFAKIKDLLNCSQFHTLQKSWKKTLLKQKEGEEEEAVWLNVDKCFAGRNERMYNLILRNMKKQDEKI